MSDHAETKEFKLSKPLKIGENSISSLTLHEPSAYEIEFAEKQSMKENDGAVNANSMAIHLIAVVSMKDANFIRQLPGRDYMRMRKYLNSFLDGSPANGEITSPT